MLPVSQSTPSNQNVTPQRHINRFGTAGVAANNLASPQQTALLKAAIKQKIDTFGQQQFSANQFSSVIQRPITQTLKEAREKAERKSLMEKLVLVGPALLLLGGLSWILKDRAKILNPILTRLGRQAITEPAKGSQAFENFGKAALGTGGLFLSANGISSGLVSDQPSMVIGNIIQFIPSLMFFFVKNNHSKNIAASLMMLAGAIFTTGFANELKNKEAKTPANEIQKYSMARFKSVFESKPSSTIAPNESKLKVFFQELGRMVRFTANDHLKLVPNAYHNVANHFWENPVHNQQDRWTEIKSWLKKPTADKSQLAAIFFILGSLPILLFRKSATIGEHAGVVGLKRLGLIFANLSLFSIAMNRKDARGKAPLLGIPLSVLGMGNSKNGLLIGAGNVGESINNLFFSEMAVNGVDTGVQSSNAPLRPQKPLSVHA